MLESGILLQNRYEIIKPIGKGGMGAVYLARDQRLGNTIALKETFFSDTLMLAAFEREARLLAGLRHSALPKVMDHFADDNGQFLIMEFIPGEDLQDLLQSSTQAFQTDEVLHWADQILDALDYLHSQEPQIIHRDIKPQNLKLTSRNQVVLLDFGLAKSGVANSTNTTSGQSLFAYTPIYAPLEQIQGAGTDVRSDIYSLGATLYHLLTGDKPIDALTRAGDFLNGKPDPLVFAHLKNPRISSAVGTVIAQAMALNRDLRPATAIMMRKLLRDAALVSTQSLAIQEQTILAQTKIFHANAKEQLPLVTKGQLTPKTSANAVRQVATHQRPATPKYSSPNGALQSPRATTPVWSSPSVNSNANESSGWGKLIAVALVLIVLGAIFAFRLNGNSNPESNGESKPNNTTLSEQENLRNQSDVGAKTSSSIPDGQYQTPTPVATPERASQQEDSPQKVAEEKPTTAEPEPTKKPEAVEAKKEPEKTETPQTQQAAKQPEPSREEERRPPPPYFPPPPPPHRGGPPPPPPGGGPPPHHRRP